jgi:hypothetical protein
MPASDYVVLLDSNRDLDERDVADFTARIPPLSGSIDGEPDSWFRQMLTSQRLKRNVFRTT